MSLRDEFVPVSRERACPICERRDWCLVSREGGPEPVAAICPRTESPIRWGGAGWLHRLQGDAPRPRRRGVELEPVPVDHRREAERLARGANLDPVAASLGLPSSVLRRLLVGFGEDFFGPFSSWPQFDEELRVVGISLRRTDGSKRLRSGDRAGLHVPIDLPDDLSRERILVVEGGSDAAAGLALGRLAVGRHSVLACFKELKRLLRRRRPGAISIVADREEHGAGLRGAEQLARVLSVVSPDVRLVEPPPGVKDLRAWLAAGLRSAELSRIEAAAPRIAEAAR